MSLTIDADCGGTSNATPNGSLFCSSAPVRVRISNLYFSPSGRSGMKISQTPAGTSSRIACTRPSQPLKSPITLTRSAFGAHTAKCTPVVEPIVIRCAPSFSKIAKVRAFAEQVEIEIGEDASVAIRIVDLDRRDRRET